MDTLDKMTQDRLDELEKRIRAEYAEASAYAIRRGREFELDMQAKISVNQKRLADGEITQDYFNRWLTNQVGRSDEWKHIRDQLAQRAMTADKVAAAYINDTTPGIYSLNANYTAWRIGTAITRLGSGAAMGVDFDLVDEQTVKELMGGGNHITFRVNGVNSKADYEWNAEQIQHALTQGILTGQGIKDISARFLAVMQRDQAAAIRNARTSVTSAENAGRQHTYEEAEKMGIELLKEWMATSDERTRESHAMLDGVRVKQDKDFPNGLAYPGDPKGAPEEVYNCRCTTRAVMPRMKGTVKAHDTGKTEETYKDWERRKKEEAEAKKAQNEAKRVQEEQRREDLDANKKYTAEDIAKKSQKIKVTMDSATFKEYTETIAVAPNAHLFYQHSDEISGIHRNDEGNGYYKNGVKRIEYSYETQKHIDNGMDKLSTLYHEYNHFFDEIMSKEGLTYNEIDYINQACPIGSGLYKTFKIKTASSSDNFLEAIRKDRAQLEGVIKTSQWRDLIKDDVTAGVQDFADGCFGKHAVTRWGHGDKYYNRFYNGPIKTFGNEVKLKEAYNSLGMSNITSVAKTKSEARIYEAASEAWANIGSAVTINGKELEAIKKYMPNSYEAYMKIIGGAK